MSHYVQVAPNIRVYAEDTGKGKPVVFIPGWPFDNTCYEYQFNYLPEHGIRCIGLDLRGYGKSDRPWSKLDYDVFVSDIDKVLKEFAIKDATLLGHSMGGAIAMHYAATHGREHISKLVLCGAAGPIWTQRPDFPYGFTREQVNDLLDLCYTDRPQLLENFRKLFFLTDTSHTAAFGRWFEQSGLYGSAYATAQCLIALRDTDLRSEMSKINIPTAIFHGIYDRVCPFDLGKQLNKGIKNSTLIPFEKSGHGLFYDERKKFNEELIKFVTSKI